MKASITMTRVLKPAEWQRHGRGRELQFFARGDELASFFLALPDEFGPYDVVGSRLVADGKLFRHESFAMSLSDFLSALREGSAPDQCFIRSGNLTPILPLGEQDALAWFSVNGLVLVQHGFRRDGKREDSRIAIVRLAVHRETGEVVRLESQQRIFDALRKRIRKDLRYASIKRFPDGNEVEFKQVMMTEGAAEEGRRGELTMRPGTERKKKR